METITFSSCWDSLRAAGSERWLAVMLRPSRSERAKKSLPFLGQEGTKFLYICVSIELHIFVMYVLCIYLFIWLHQHK